MPLAATCAFMVQMQMIPASSCEEFANEVWRGMDSFRPDHSLKKRFGVHNMIGAHAGNHEPDMSDWGRWVYDYYFPEPGSFEDILESEPQEAMFSQTKIDPKAGSSKISGGFF